MLRYYNTYKNNENDFMLYCLDDSFDIIFNKFTDDLNCLTKLDDGLFEL